MPASLSPNAGRARPGKLHQLARPSCFSIPDKTVNSGGVRYKAIAAVKRRREPIPFAAIRKGPVTHLCMSGRATDDPRRPFIALEPVFSSQMPFIAATTSAACK